ncbi:slightly ste11-like protein [Marasmius crinis-equi]|uniref:Slightly ste11-like protein n=1 Tax=Marasmius crinis-equi TaxID=585013 RepID=A0ABR3FTU5_9AGAR
MVRIALGEPRDWPSPDSMSACLTKPTVSSEPRLRRSVNAFLLYRRDAVTAGAVSKTFLNVDGEVQCKRQSDISKEVGKMWNSAPEGVKILYRGLAAIQGNGLEKEPDNGNFPSSFMEGGTTSESNTELQISKAHTALIIRKNTASRNKERRPLSLRGTKIPRPANAFILYRRDALFSGVVATTMMGEDGPRARSQSEISKDIACLWHNAPECLKSHYNSLAEQKKKEHKEKYPEYKYSPGPPKRKNRADRSGIDRSRYTESSR